MGKKKVAQKSEAEVLKEAGSVENKGSQGKKGSAKQKIEDGKIFISASYNNTMISVTDAQGNLVTWMSAGSLGFSGPKKSTPFAASKVAEAIFEKIQKTGPFRVEVFVRGLGGGRDSAVRSFAGKGMEIISVKDVTPIPHNGPRPKKVRRV
ncbi:MAG: 30S ribosomal protein S11 [bacterium]|nr:30S ribosomal protein S11 [bacterium]